MSKENLTSVPCIPTAKAGGFTARFDKPKM